MSKPFGNPAHDVLPFYGEKDGSALDRLRDIYTIGIGFGIRESSGNPSAGWDPNGPKTESGAEAGLFQSSYDAIGRDTWLRRLYDAYRKDPSRCLMSVFRRGTHDPGTTVIGQGDGAAFQRFTKSCPAFATEYAMVALRVNRSHYGTINKRHVAAVPACREMFKDVEAAVQCTSPRLMAFDLEGVNDGRHHPDLVAEAAQFIAPLRKCTGRDPVLYANQSPMRAVAAAYRSGSAFAHTPLRLAAPTISLTPNRPWKDNILWQLGAEWDYDSPGEIDYAKRDPKARHPIVGSHYDLDVDLFRASLDQLHALFGPALRPDPICADT